MKKIDKFKTSEVTVAVAVAVVAWVSTIFPLIFSNLPLLTLLYHLYCGYKVLKMTWSIIERKTDEFNTFGVTVSTAVAIVAWVSTYFLSISSG